MLKFLFVISFGFGIPTKYSDSLKCNHGVQSSLIGDLLVCHYFHGTQAQWSKGAQGFQACLDLALRFWFLNLREVGLGTILSYGLRTIWILCTYIYIHDIYEFISKRFAPFCTCEPFPRWQILHWTGPLKPWRHHGVNRKLWEPYTRERGYLVINRRNMLSWVHPIFLWCFFWWWCWRCFLPLCSRDI